MADAAWKKLKVTAKRGKKRDAGDTTHKLLKEKELIKTDSAQSSSNKCKN